MKKQCLFIILALAPTCSLVFAAEPTRAIAVLHSTSGSNVSGVVTFTASGDQVKVVADVTGLTQGKHGFHVHGFGDCSDRKAASAGGHFNPGIHQHGAPD